LTYQRNAAGDVLSLTDGKGQITRYSYDQYGRLAAETLTDGRQRTYDYRTDNLLESVTEPDGTVVEFTYDTTKQLVSVSRGSQTTTYEYDARGLLTKASNEVGVVTRTYDAAGRLVTENVNGETVAYTYNAENELMSVSALGQTRSYERDSRGLLTSMTAPEGPYNFGYDALARRTSMSMPNGENVAYGYNVSGQPTSISHAGPYQNNLQYSYNARGLISNYSGKDFSWNYGYGPDGQLTSADSALANERYQYDDAGNLIGDAQVYDEANRLLEDNTYQYQYDQQGNLTTKVNKVSGEKTTYQWDDWDQLVTIERFTTSNAPSPNLTKSFTYGPLDRRWSTTENGVKTDYVYDQSDRIAALDQSGNVNQRVTFGPAVDEPFAITGQSSTNYLHANHIGSVVGTSSSGVTLGEYRYSPFGKRLQAPEPALDNPFQYAGREYEGDGLYYNRARYYDSVSSRFISEDPLGTFPGNTNLYTYAQNNPIHGTDPSGRIVMFAIPALYFAVEVGLSLYDAYDTVSTLVDPCLSAGEKWLAGGLWVLGAIAPGGGYTAADDIARGVAKSVAPNAAQAKNLKRFQKKIPSNSKENVELRGLPNNGVAVQASSAGKVPGSRAVYEKQIDVNGKTIQATKTTYNPQGNIVHVKDKLNGGTYP
jgi:RHS repeat-associated protein